MVVGRNLGITFGLVVRAMGFSKTVVGGISSLRQGEVSQFTTCGGYEPPPPARCG